MKIFDSQNVLKEDGGDLFRVYTQHLPEEFMDELKREQDEFQFNKDGYTKVASIPVALFDKWLNEGFDAYNAPVADIITRLKMEGYDLFVTSKNKRL